MYPLSRYLGRSALTLIATFAHCAESPPERWAYHGQITFVEQAHAGFSAPYSGPNSLAADRDAKETTSFDLIAGARPWHDTEVFADGLAWQGFGLSNATGAAGFPNGEAFRLGTSAPNARVVRLFVRQTFGLGGGQETVEDDAFAIRGVRDASRVTLTLGKLSAKDVFDNNAYANDPRIQFLNWALMANEAWDYPADSLGFTTGATAELKQPDWAVRAGVFRMPRVANGISLDPRLTKAWGSVIEVERDFRVAGRHAAVKASVYWNRAHMGNYAAALAGRTQPPDLAATRTDRGKSGVLLNVEQQVTEQLGVFARLGSSDGHNEAWAFADVDRSASAGVSMRGEWWGRAGDTAGLAGVMNGISDAHRRFLAAGGTGILVGDGRLRYAPEEIIEAYYNWKLVGRLAVALDYQLLRNPAFNADRGPVSVAATRLHFEF